MKLSLRALYFPFLAVVLAGLFALPVGAQDTAATGHRLQDLREMHKRENNAPKGSEEAFGAHSQSLLRDQFNGREMLVYLPSPLPPQGVRSLVIALHGGIGNAQSFHSRLKMDGVAEKYGLIVAYLDGSPAGLLGPKMLAWNAGSGCCGAPYRNKVDDIDYITGAVHYLEQKYGVDPGRVYGIGHSNGAMMTQTLMCKTDLYHTAISLAGSLMAEGASCPNARGKTLLAIHGEQDANVPPGGGKGTKGVTNINFKSEQDSKTMFERSGGKYIIQLLPSADHSLEHIGAAIQKAEGISLAEKAARFFGLAQTAHQ